MNVVVLHTAPLGGQLMIVQSYTEVEKVQVGSIDYKGKELPVEGVTVQWVSKAGQDSSGAPAYGLRVFTIAPGGQIPIHNHFYVQTMYILTGQFECWQFDADTDEITDRKICGPGDVVYLASMEPHGMRNISDTEEGTFLCCICNVETDEPAACIGG
jgi:quercetin dioxygenase-like cupin family protein